MNSALWASMREYIAAEVNLAVARHTAATTTDPMVRRIAIEEDIPKLEGQSTRMETDIRECIEKIERNDAARRRSDILNMPLS